MKSIIERETTCKRNSDIEVLNTYSKIIVTIVAIVLRGLILKIIVSIVAIALLDLILNIVVTKVATVLRDLSRA